MHQGKILKMHGRSNGRSVLINTNDMLPPAEAKLSNEEAREQNPGDGDNSITSSSNSRLRRGVQILGNSANLTAALILVLGCATSAAFLGWGITSAMKDQDSQFERAATDTVSILQDSFEDYVIAAAQVHARCRRRNFSRQDFRILYDYLLATGLAFKAVQFFPNTTHEQRPAREAESRAYYAEHYPNVTYRGFVGFNELNASGGVQPRTNEPWYFPVHYMEPIPGNEAAIDLDFYSSEVRIRAVKAVFENKAPSLSDRLTLVRTAGTVSRCGNHNGPSYGVVLTHPGFNLARPKNTSPQVSQMGWGEVFYNATTNETVVEGATDNGFVDDVWPRDMASIVLCIPDLLTRKTVNIDQSSAVFVHDLNHPGGKPVFMGGAIVDGNSRNISFLDEVELDEIQAPTGRQQLQRQYNLTAANRVWTVTVVALEGTYQPSLVFVILGGVMIFLAAVFLALWVVTSARRVKKWNELTSAGQREKASLILENARQQAKTERELNDFLAHEVRNPVAAAMAACNFVSVAINQPEPLKDEASRELARDDLKIIDNALHFVNDLLRNMLDMHRAASKQLQVTLVSTDLLHDVMEPVAGMLHRRGSKIKLIMECPPNLYVLTDPLRLKQVILNLGRNSSKFIDLGFIRLKAIVVNGMVRIHVDDSGCGVPEDKQDSLFQKFQESLDVLSQGTVCFLPRVVGILSQ
jgi:signal transduction histidine kinase